MIGRYHDGTKHHVHRYARSLGYLDWASQPNPFRAYDGAAAVELPPRPGASPAHARLGAVLRHALGLTAWKRFRESRWSLRANPSSGNLHPTEAYVVLPDAGVFHYAPDRHSLEHRCLCSPPLPAGLVLVALTSIHWREAWKYGERAFRYCQHDLGHAIAAVRLAAALEGGSATLVPDWSHAQIASLCGIDRDADFVDAEREEPACLIALRLPDGSVPGWPELLASIDAEAILRVVAEGRWAGRASQLSTDHVQWTFIDEAAEATRDPGRAVPIEPRPEAIGFVDPPYTAALIRQRRSAVAFDGRSSLSRSTFLAILRATLPGNAPFDALWWSARIHLATFVHRVDDVEPGLYLLTREPESGSRLVSALGRDFAIESADASLPLLRLGPGDCRALARRVSCDQDIASDGFFSLGMIAEFDRSLEEFGPAFYRHLFWESGFVGQILYLEAEAAGARATGIGCFFDDVVHDVLGLAGHAFQSLYHFTVGMPVEDARLTTEPGYAWEDQSSQASD